MLWNLANRIFGDITLLFNRSEEYAKNRLNILWFSVFSNIVIILCDGYFFTGLLLRLNASDAFIGFTTVATYFGGVAAVFSPLLFTRFAKRKTLLILSRGLYYILLLGFVTAAPYMGSGRDAQLALILCAITLANLALSLTNSGMSAWHLQSMPESVRSTFYSNLNMIMGVLNMILLNLASFLADYFKSSGQELFGIVLLRLMACLFALVELWCLCRIKEYPAEKPERQAGILETLRIPLQNKRYLAVTAIVMVWTFTASIPGPYYQVFLLRNLKISYSFLSIINLLNIPVLLIAMPIWGRVIARVGEARLFPKLMVLIALHFLSLAFVTGSNYSWLYPASVFYYFLIAAGIAQTVSMMPYRFMPEADKSSFMTFHGIAATLSALLGTVLGLVFVTSMLSVKIYLFGFGLGNKQLLMMFAAAAVLAGTIATHFINRWLKKADKPAEAESIRVEA